MSFSGSDEIPKQPNRITSQPLDPVGTGVGVCSCLGITGERPHTFAGRWPPIGVIKNQVLTGPPKAIY
jgi:hypothetical protein